MASPGSSWMIWRAGGTPGLVLPELLPPAACCGSEPAAAPVAAQHRTGLLRCLLGPRQQAPPPPPPASAAARGSGSSPFAGLGPTHPGFCALLDEIALRRMSGSSASSYCVFAGGSFSSFSASCDALAGGSCSGSCVAARDGSQLAAQLRGWSASSSTHAAPAPAAAAAGESCPAGWELGRDSSFVSRAGSLRACSGSSNARAAASTTVSYAAAVATVLQQAQPQPCSKQEQAEAQAAPVQAQWLAAAPVAAAAAAATDVYARAEASTMCADDVYARSEAAAAPAAARTVLRVAAPAGVHKPHRPARASRARQLMQFLEGKLQVSRLLAAAWLCRHCAFSSSSCRQRARGGGASPQLAHLCCLLCTGQAAAVRGARPLQPANAPALRGPVGGLRCRTGCRQHQQQLQQR